MSDSSSQRDVTHIHSEIRQLRNQQFLITIAAITLFGFHSQWLLTFKDEPIESKSENSSLVHAGTDGFASSSTEIAKNTKRESDTQKESDHAAEKKVGAWRGVATSGFIVTLSFLFFLIRRLRNLIQTFATYLRVWNLSDWERHYLTFTTNNPRQFISQTGLHAAIFIVLGSAALGQMFLTSIGLHWAIDSVSTAALAFVIFMMHIVFVIGMGFFGWFFDEEAVNRRWKRIRKQDLQKAKDSTTETVPV